jgi:hypothetical protein
LCHRPSCSFFPRWASKQARGRASRSSKTRFNAHRHAYKPNLSNPSLLLASSPLALSVAAFIEPWTDSSTTASPSLSRRTLAPTAPSATPLSISPLPLRLSVPSRSSPARRSLSARSLSSLLASLRLLLRRLRLLTVRVLVPRARAVAPRAVVAVAAAVVVDAAPVVDVPVVTPTTRLRATPLLAMPPLRRPLPPPKTLRMPRLALSVSAASGALLLMECPPRPRSWLPTCPTT